MTSFDLRVSTPSLRRAFEAVLPHAGADPELPTLMRVRLHVVPGAVIVAATDRYTLGIARVDLLDSTGEVGVLDVPPDDVRLILGTFKVPKELLAEAEVRLEWDEKSLRVTDVSGMFDAEKDLGLPALPIDEQFPDLAAMVERIAGYIDKPEDSPYLSVNAPYLVRFAKAQAHYGEPLVFETAGRSRALIVTCGSEFLGALVPNRQDEEQIGKFTGHRADWFQTFPLLHDVHPSPGDPELTYQQRLMARAVEVVVREQKCGRAFLCAELDITQREAREVITQLEKDGVVGPARLGGSSHEVLVSAPLFPADGGEDL